MSLLEIMKSIMCSILYNLWVIVYRLFVIMDCVWAIEYNVWLLCRMCACVIVHTVGSLSMIDKSSCTIFGSLCMRYRSSCLHHVQY